MLDKTHFVIEQLLIICDFGSIYYINKNMHLIVRKDNKNNTALLN